MLREPKGRDPGGFEAGGTACHRPCHTLPGPADVPLVHANMTTTPRPPRAAFGPELRRDLLAMVKKRVPESDVEDIVQAALTEAFESPHAPTDPEQLRRWVFGVAKHKVVDFHRKRGRETFDVPEVPGGPAPHVEADLLRWAEKNLPEGDDAKATLDWMLREGEGEKLESIAASEKLPAPRVRQRVSRLRRHLKDNWQREVALLAAVGVVLGALVLFLRRREDPKIQFDPNGIPMDPRAEAMRRDGLERCAKGEWRPCLEKLDDAKRLDPAGDGRPEVQRAREGAEKALSPITPPPAEVPTTRLDDVAPAPSPSPSALSSALPSPSPSVLSSAPPPTPTAAPRDVKALQESAKTGLPIAKPTEAEPTLPTPVKPTYPTKGGKPAAAKPSPKTGGSEIEPLDLGSLGSSNGSGSGSGATKKKAAPSTPPPPPKSAPVDTK